MPAACVLVTHLPLKVELLRRPDLRAQPVIIVVTVRRRRTVLNRSPEASGVAPGTPLEHALARCPPAAIIEADHSAYREVWDRMLDSLEQRSPVVEDAGLGLAYVDLRGLEGMYGGEERMLHAIANAVPAVYRPRLGMAAGKFPAYVAALRAEPGSAFRLPEDAASSLASMPLTMIPARWGTRERLLGFGLRALGDLAALPIGAVQAQLGREGARLWHLAQGQDTSPLIPRQHEETIAGGLTLPAATASLPALAVAPEALVTRVFSDGLRGRCARVARRTQS